MFRRLMFLCALLSTAVMASPTAKPAVPVKTVSNTVSNDVDTRVNQYLPTVSDPNELHACYCIRQGEDCSPILAASSGLCTANTLRRRQPDPCILRCANYCLYKARSHPICQRLDDWLVEKVHKITRKSLF